MELTYIDERLLLIAAKTRFRAGIDYTSTASDFLRGPLATYSQSQPPLLSTSWERETSAQPRQLHNTTVDIVLWRLFYFFLESPRLRGYL